MPEVKTRLTMPNGAKPNGFEVRSDGSVLIMCDDGVVRRVHPAVVAAFADGRITPGVWSVASHYMQNPGLKIILPPPS